MWVAIIILASWLGMALTTKEPRLRKRRLALCGIMILIGIAVRLFNVQF